MAVVLTADEDWGLKLLFNIIREFLGSLLLALLVEVVLALGDGTANHAGHCQAYCNLALLLALHAPLNLCDAVLASYGLHWLLDTAFALSIDLVIGLDSHELYAFRVEVLATVAYASHCGHGLLTVTANLSIRLLLREHFLNHHVWLDLLEDRRSHGGHVGLLLLRIVHSPGLKVLLLVLRVHPRLLLRRLSVHHAVLRPHWHLLRIAGESLGHVRLLVSHVVHGGLRHHWSLRPLRVHLGVVILALGTDLLFFRFRFLALTLNIQLIVH